MNLDVLCVGHASCDVSLFVEHYPLAVRPVIRSEFG